MSFFPNLKLFSHDFEIFLYHLAKTRFVMYHTLWWKVLSLEIVPYFPKCSRTCWWWRHFNSHGLTHFGSWVINGNTWSFGKNCGFLYNKFLTVMYYLLLFIQLCRALSIVFFKIFVYLIWMILSHVMISQS